MRLIVCICMCVCLGSSSAIAFDDDITYLLSQEITTITQPKYKRSEESITLLFNPWADHSNLTNIDRDPFGVPYATNFVPEPISLFDKSEHMLSLSLVGGVLGATQFLAIQTDVGEHAVELTMDIAQSVMMSLLTSGVLRQIGDEVNSEKFRNNIAPSYQTASAFAVAGVLSHYYPWYIGTPALAVASSLALAHSNMKPKATPETLVGSGIGLFYAATICFPETLSSNDSDTINSKRKFVPLISKDTFGVSLTASF